MKRILFIDKTHELLKQTLASHGFECEEFKGNSLEDLLALNDQYQGFVIRSRFHIGDEVLQHFPSLRFIARSGSGMESIDVEAARAHGVRCLNSPEGNRDAVAEHTVGMLLSLFNKINLADAEMRRSIWRREENRGRELRGMTIGLIGYGNTGTAFAQRLEGFGVDVLAYDKFKVGFSDAWASESKMEEIFQRADILSLHVPLTDETRHLVDEAYIQSFHKNIYLINTSRGPVIDTKAVVDALKSGKILGACLDVHEYEKASFVNIEAGENEDMAFLLGSDQVVLTPHIAGWTVESELRLAEVLAEKILAYFG